MTAVMVDQRRITEQDPDFRTLHAATRAKLTRSLRRYVREVRAGAPSADSAFIRRHVGLLRDAYTAGHHEGQRDYWQAVSLRRPRISPPDPAQAQRLLRFYAPSVTKMATEARQIASQIQLDELGDWHGQLGARIQLQADLTWSAFQDGYLDAGNLDKARPWLNVYWVLEPLAQHCSDCPEYAAGSPYGPPGSGRNELTATPGDGHTACGAACKCGLSYGPGAEDDQVTWTGIIPPNAPLAQLWPKELPPITLGMPQNPVLTDGQKAALDAFRAATDRWDVYRGGLPELPDLFESNGDFSLELPWEQLSEKQQQALAEVIDALRAWQDAGGGQPG